MKKDAKKGLTSQGLNREVMEILEGSEERRSRDQGPEIYPGLAGCGIGAEPPAEAERADADETLYEDRSRAAGREDDRRPDRRSEESAPKQPELRRTSADGALEPHPVRRRSGGPYRFISGAFILLFVVLIGHLVIFNASTGEVYVNSTYNKNRRNKMAQTVMRGSIVSSDGSVLAYSESGEDHTEERIYPYANTFAHAVGYTTSHDTAGLESAGSSSLLRTHSNIIDQVINDVLGRKNRGDTVVSTLDAGLQEVCYRTLGSYDGAVIVMEPKTGAIRALVSKPDFDPNTLEERWSDIVADEATARLWNRATQGLYAPGSTFKIITSLAYYRAKHTLSDFHFNCTGELEVGEYKAHCFEYAEHGEEDFASAFANSCNTAFSQIGLDLGAKKLTAAAESLLFDTSLPCDLYAGRARWNLEPDASQEELVMTAFGQGKTQVTPYYMALLVSAIANRGVLMKPYLIDHVESTSGSVLSKTQTKAYRTLLTEDEASTLTELMKGVVSRGSASKLSGRSYSAAGKTGSAEYYRGDGSIGTNSWFVGFTNPDDPELVIVVLAEDGGAGSTTAVPMAAQILDYYYSR